MEISDNTVNSTVIKLVKGDNGEEAHEAVILCGSKEVVPPQANNQKAGGAPANDQRMLFIDNQLGSRSLGK